MNTPYQSSPHSANSYFSRIKAELEKAALSLMSLQAYASWPEALLVTAGYTLIAALLSSVLKFLLGFVASIAFVVGMGSFVAFLYFRFNATTQEDKYRANHMLQLATVGLVAGLGFYSLTTFSILSLTTFSILVMLVFSGYRARNLFTSAIPENPGKALNETLHSCSEKFRQFSGYLFGENSVEAPHRQGQACEKSK